MLDECSFIASPDTGGALCYSIAIDFKAVKDWCPSDTVQVSNFVRKTDIDAYSRVTTTTAARFKFGLRQPPIKVVHSSQSRSPPIPIPKYSLRWNRDGTRRYHRLLSLQETWSRPDPKLLPVRGRSWCFRCPEVLATTVRTEPCC